MTITKRKDSVNPPKKKIKTQSSLHAFLGLEDTRVPGHFHLDWENKVATFMEEMPVGIGWKDMFHWRSEKREIMVISASS
jgi:hypothetical protein